MSHKLLNRPVLRLEAFVMLVGATKIAFQIHKSQSHRIWLALPLTRIPLKA